MIALSCPNCGAQVPDPGRYAASDEAYCAYCRQSFLIDHTAGSRVTLVVPHEGFGAPCQQRVKQLGFRPGTVFTRQTFQGWTPATKSEALMIAICVQFGPPFAATHWHDVLTRSWPELVDQIGQQRHGQINAISGRGNPIILVYGQTEYDLRAAIAEAKLDAAMTAADVHSGEAPATASVVVPDPRWAPLLQQRIEQLDSRMGRVMGRDFSGWQPGETGEALVVAVCAQFGPPFAANLWHDYLGRSWPDLIDTIGKRQCGQLEAKSPTGNRVVIVYGQSDRDLQSAIQRLAW